MPEIFNALPWCGVATLIPDVGSSNLWIPANYRLIRFTFINHNKTGYGKRFRVHSRHKHQCRFHRTQSPAMSAVIFHESFSNHAISR